MNRENDVRDKLKEQINSFPFVGECIHAESFGHGHINDTFAVYFKTEKASPKRYILQRINETIFKNPYQLMENIEAVTSHIRKKIVAEGGDPSRRVLTVIKTYKNELLFKDSNNRYWRAYEFIDDATSLQQIENPEHFYWSAKAFGRFQMQLGDFPADKLYETIPNFHNTEKRFENLVGAIEKNSVDRAKNAQAEIEFALSFKKDASVLVDMLNRGKLPLRVTHNDTKLNNVMIDNATGEGICVIDLDTVMPGLSLYDFGDSIRFGASTAAEDEKDLSKVSMSLVLYEAFTKGFLEEAGETLTEAEKEYLPFGAKIMTLECGMRFLTDYLEGDVYFRTHYPEQNLDRCRTQFKLVKDMENKMPQMKEIVEKYA